MYEYACEVQRIIDGDSIVGRISLGFDIYFNSSIRLFAIDTPESRTRNLDEKARGLLAKDFLKDCIENGKRIVIKTELKDSRGKFGRVLATLWVDGVNINQALVDNYLAVAYHGQAKKDVEDEHLANRQKLIDLNIYKPEAKT
tara:strand:- start:452 stop:880 length:429 start_codon:yes stop_codon:yes gene_type:complete